LGHYPNQVWLLFLTNHASINYLFFLFCTKLSTTDGSASVVVSPNW
jgi:hypothetical protein